MTSLAAPLTRLHWHHPEWVIAVVAAAGSLVLVAPLANDPRLLVHGPEHHGVGALAVNNAAMACAMMAPLITTRVHDVAVSALWARRYRAALGYMTGYVVVWTVVGAAMMLGGHVMEIGLGRFPVVVIAAALAVAVAATEVHRRQLRRCHASRPLALTGWRADRDCLDEGVRMAGRCVATTWSLMLFVMVQQGLLVMAVATVVMVMERRMLLSPRRIQWWTIGVGALGVVLTAGSIVAAGDSLMMPSMDMHHGQAPWGVGHHLVER